MILSALTALYTKIVFHLTISIHGGGIHAQIPWSPFGQLVLATIPPETSSSFCHGMNRGAVDI